MSDELKSCPFCGSDMILGVGDGQETPMSLMCDDCGAGFSDERISINEQNRLWNQRVPSRAVSQMASDVYHGLAQDEPAWIFDPTFNVGSNELIELKIPWETLRHFLAETLPITRRPRG